VHLEAALEPRELTPEEAARARDRITRHYRGHRLDRVEILADGRLTLLRYFDRLWPDDDLLEQTRREYGDVAFEVFSPGGTRVWSVRPDGTLGEYVDRELDADGDVLAETRHHPDGTRFARTEYVYGDDGELRLTRELDADGNVVDELES
jgi:hypothetical protein